MCLLRSSLKLQYEPRHRDLVYTVSSSTAASLSSLARRLLLSLRPRSAASVPSLVFRAGEPPSELLCGVAVPIPTHLQGHAPANNSNRFGTFYTTPCYSGECWKMYWTSISQIKPRSFQENWVRKKVDETSIKEAAGISGRFVKQNNGNAGEPSGNWCLGPRTGDVFWESPGVLPRKISRLYAQNPAI